jgi:two-component system LytT family response regulator
MINAIIIDDEAHCRKNLRNLLLNASHKINVQTECSSVVEAKEAIINYNPDLIFLDVEMPGSNGFDLLNEVEEINFEIIFTSAYDKYAIQAIRSSALDFLLKPITKEDLEDALMRFKSKKNITQTQRQVEVLLQNYGQPQDLKRIVVPTNTGLEFIPVNSIIHLQASSNYTTFYLTEDKKLTIAKTLKDMEELLPERPFYRVHQSHIINTNYIKQFLKSDGGVLIMDDKSIIPISRQRKDELLAILKARH